MSKKFRKKNQPNGGWMIDGIQYATAREAARSVGMSNQAFIGKCLKLGSRQVTSADLDLDGYRRRAHWMKKDADPNDEWEMLSATENTGAARREFDATPALYRRTSMPVCRLSLF